jgi:septal ring-binding cell division protein DamX
VTLGCRENPRHRPLSRLATVRQLAAFALALALGGAAALALVSCGGGEDAKLLPGNTAREISENLDSVKQFVGEGECVGAENAAQEVSNQVEALSGVDEKLKQALQRGAEKLDEVVLTCDETETEAVAPAGEAPSTEEEDELPPGLEKKAEKEREKEEKELEKEEEKQEKDEEKEEPPATPTTPSETTPAEPPATPAPPSEGGGSGASGGVGAAAHAEEGE